MTLKQEVQEIITNAQSAYKRGEITAEQYCDVTRIPMKDLLLTLPEEFGEFDFGSVQ